MLCKVCSHFYSWEVKKFSFAHPGTPLLYVDFFSARELVTNVIIIFTECTFNLMCDIFNYASSVHVLMYVLHNYTCIRAYTRRTPGHTHIRTRIVMCAVHVIYSMFTY